MKKLFVLALAVVVLLAVGILSRNRLISAEKYRTLMTQTCFAVPDTLLNYEQLSMKIKVMDYLYVHMTVRDNKQCLSGSRRQMKMAGIPAFYYDVIRYQMHATNAFVKRALKDGSLPADVLDVETKIAEAKARYWETERPEMQERLERLR